jgi:ubiquitin thioesterase protein OTUB1
MNPDANYHALSQGPLVGQRQPSSAITQEYATADATYQTKTAVCIDVRYACILVTDISSQALPQKYSHYRKLRGDGKCGWRGKSDCI